MAKCIHRNCINMLIDVHSHSIAQSKRPVIKRGRTEATDGEQTATEKAVMPPLELPSNATSIRADITDSFSCENRGYGYYADVENECQIFHVCLPVMNADERKERTFRWSFICPEETVFSQVVFTCVRMEDMPNECKDSEQYYQLNKNFGMAMNENGSDSMKETDPEMMATEGSETEKAEEMQQMMIERIETTTDAKMLIEDMKPVAAEEKPVPEQEQNEMDSNIKVVIRDSDMTQGLLPPLANEVYRAGTNGEAQMPESQHVELIAEETGDQLDVVNELESDSSSALPEVLDLKESVIQAVENIIEEHTGPTLNEQPIATDAKKMRRIPDPRGRRFLFRADARRNF